MDPGELCLVHPAVGDLAFEHPYVTRPNPAEVLSRELLTIEVSTGTDRRDCHPPTVAEMPGAMRHAEGWSASLFQRRKRSPVAQLAEHLTVNQRVTGSSPVGGAKHLA